AKKNAILPIGGPGPALSFKEQGELLFSLVKQEPNFICVPYGVFDFVQGILDFIAGLFPSQSDLAEYGRIGRYYAEQSMLVLDPATGKYSEELTPSYGRTDLRAFLTEALE
ncbi:DVR, partial [Symbiodinium sp. KB8]